MSRKRRDYWGYFPKSKPIPVKNGIKAHTKRGQFGEHWWAQRWIEVLESFGWDNRLRRGRTYARKGQVLGIDIQLGRINARVQGSRRTPYSVRIKIMPLTDKQWELAIDAIAQQALFAAQLFSGEMPPEIEQAIRSAGVSLFPTSMDIDMQCSCPDWAVPCKHIAAVYYLLAEEFDRDPFLLFKLRGCTREHLMTALRARRAAGASDEDENWAEEDLEEEIVPLEDSLAHFWEPQEDSERSAEDFYVTIAPPSVETALLKRLGPPPFSRRPEAFVGVLALAYATVTERALKLAFGEDREENGE
mgnify:CR=1 FL=1